MKKIRLLSLFILFPIIHTFLFTACSSTREVKLTEKRLALATPPPRTPENADFWRQMDFTRFYRKLRALDFNSIEKDKLSPSQKIFLKGFNAWRDGDEKQSEKIIRKLLDDEDETIKNTAKSFLRDLYWGQCRWWDLSQLFPDSEQYEVLANTPEMKIVFKKAQSEFKNAVSKHLIIPIRIGKQKLRFCLDTGASTTMISSKMIGRHGIKLLDNSLFVHGSINSKVGAVRYALVPKMRIGDILVKNQVAIVFDKESFYAKVSGDDGIIGWSVLRHIAMRINGRNLILEKPLDKISCKANLLCLGKPVLLLEGEKGQKFRFMLDTGSPSSHLEFGVFNRINTSDAYWSETKMGGWVGIEKSKMVILPELDLKTADQILNFRNCHTLFQRGLGYSRDGLIGNREITRNYSSETLIDYQNRRLKYFVGEKNGQENDKWFRNHAKTFRLGNNLGHATLLPAALGKVTGIWFIGIPSAIATSPIALCVLPISKSAAKKTFFIPMLLGLDFGEILFGGPSWLLTAEWWPNKTFDVANYRDCQDLFYRFAAFKAAKQKPEALACAKLIAKRSPYFAPILARGYLEDSFKKYIDGEYQEIVSNLNNSVELNPKKPFPAIIRFLSKVKMNSSNMLSAHNELKEWAEQNLDNDEWPAGIVKLYLDRLTPEKFIETVPGNCSYQKQLNLCEAWYYLGEYWLWRKECKKAKECFQKCVDCDVPDYIEYKISKKYLKPISL